MSIRTMALVLILTTGASAVAGEPKTEWMRQSVMLRTDDVKPGKLVGKELVRGDKPLDANVSYKVRAEKGDFLELAGYYGPLGWIAKTDVLPVEVEEAVAFFTDKIKAEPTVAKWHGRRGMSQMRSRQVRIGAVEVLPKSSTDPAFGDLTMAVRLDPKCVDWHIHLGSTFAKYLEMDEALKCFEEAVRLAPDRAIAYGERAKIWLLRPDFDKCLADMNTAIKFEPQVALRYCSRGFVLWQMGLTHTALTDFDRALELDPGCVTALAHRGAIRHQLGELDQALSDLDKAYELDPSESQILPIRVHVLGLKKEYRRAREDAEQLVKLSPTDSESLKLLGWLLAVCSDDKIRDPKRSVELMHKAVKQAGASVPPGVYDALAAAHAANGEFDAAVREATKALDIINAQNPRNMAALYDVTKRLELYKACSVEIIGRDGGISGHEHSPPDDQVAAGRRPQGDGGG